MKRARSYSGDSKRAAVRVFRAASESALANRAQSLSALDLASSAAGGASTRSIYRWSNQDISQHSIDDRLSHRGRYAKFSDEQNALMVGYVVDRRVNLLRVSRSDVINFANEYLGINVRPQHVSELMKTNDLTLQKSRSRNARMVSEEVVNDAIAVILKLREYDFPPDRILIMDETSLWSNVVQPRTYHFKNWSVIGFIRSLPIFPTDRVMVSQRP